MFKRKKGFTLLELMIVVIIIGILASLAIPRFINAANRARAAEARQMLGVIRASQLRYYAENVRWHVDADSDLSSGSALDIDIPLSDYFTYNGAQNSAYSSEDDIVAQAIGKNQMLNTNISIEADGDWQ